jgi:hypothetical protein
VSHTAAAVPHGGALSAPRGASADSLRGDPGVPRAGGRNPAVAVPGAHRSSAAPLSSGEALAVELTVLPAPVSRSMTSPSSLWWKGWASSGCLSGLDAA